MLQAVARELRESEAQAKLAPDLVSLGKLVPARGWYKLVDATALNTIGKLITGFRIGRDNKVTHMQLTRSLKKLQRSK